MPARPDAPHMPTYSAAAEMSFFALDAFSFLLISRICSKDRAMLLASSHSVIMMLAKADIETPCSAAFSLTLVYVASVKLTLILFGFPFIIAPPGLSTCVNFTHPCSKLSILFFPGSTFSNFFSRLFRFCSTLSNFFQILPFLFDFIELLRPTLPRYRLALRVFVSLISCAAQLEPTRLAISRRVFPGQSSSERIRSDRDPPSCAGRCPHPCPVLAAALLTPPVYSSFRCVFGSRHCSMHRTSARGNCVLPGRSLSSPMCSHFDPIRVMCYSLVRLYSIYCTSPKNSV
jgi:hypothetical protein